MRKEYLSDVNLLWCARYDYECGWRLKEHDHDHYQLMYIIGGSADGEVNGNVMPITGHTVMFIKPRECHSIDNVSTDGLKTLDVKFSVNSSLLDRKLHDIPSFCTVVDDEFRDTLELIRIEGDEQDYEYQALSSAYLAIVLLKLIRMQYPAKSLVKPKLEYYYRDDLSSTVIKMIAFAENNTNRELKSTDFEKLTNSSYRFLSRLSKEETGMTPIELAMHHRISKAKEQLLLSKLEIKEIAENLGFSNVHNFTRVFTRECGMPPGRFRKESLQGIRKDIVFENGYINEINTQF